jgi:hypothetical protein
VLKLSSVLIPNTTERRNGCRQHDRDANEDTGRN